MTGLLGLRIDQVMRELVCIHATTIPPLVQSNIIYGRAQHINEYTLYITQPGSEDIPVNTEVTLVHSNTTGKELKAFLRTLIGA